MISKSFFTMVDFNQLYQNIKTYNFDCFQNKEKPSLWENIQKCFWTFVHGFICDEYTSRAASLTYYTITSLVPFFAFFFSMVSTDIIDTIKELLLNVIPEENIANHAFNAFNNYGKTKVHPLIASGSIIVMLWATYSLFYNVIHTLNSTIWKVEDRPIINRLKFYGLSLFIILLAVTFLKELKEYLSLLSFVIVFVVSFFVYRFFPNVQYNKDESHITNGPQIKGCFCGALIFVILSYLFSNIFVFFSEMILNSYIRNYGKTFYVIFFILAWIWAFYVLFLSCAKIGQFIDSPKQNDIKSKKNISKHPLLVHLIIETLRNRHKQQEKS